MATAKNGGDPGGGGESMPSVPINPMGARSGRANGVSASVIGAPMVRDVHSTIAGMATSSRPPRMNQPVRPSVAKLTGFTRRGGV